MLLLAWAAIGIMRREVMTDEAIFRLKEAPQWRELSPLHRRRMMLLDWPLFFAIREREVERLLYQPLTKVVFAPQGVTRSRPSRWCNFGCRSEERPVGTEGVSTCRSRW